MNKNKWLKQGSTWSEWALLIIKQLLAHFLHQSWLCHTVTGPTFLHSLAPVHMRVWHWCQTQQELTLPVVLGSGWAEFFIEWLNLVGAQFHKYFEKNHTYLLEFRAYMGRWVLAFWHMIVVKVCWDVDQTDPGSCRVRVRCLSRVKRQHDSSDSLTCCRVWSPARILSPVPWGLTSATLTSLSQPSIIVQSASEPLATLHHMVLLSAWPAHLTLIWKQCRDQWANTEMNL